MVNNLDNRCANYLTGFAHPTLAKAKIAELEVIAVERLEQALNQLRNG